MAVVVTVGCVFLCMSCSEFLRNTLPPAGNRRRSEFRRQEAATNYYHLRKRLLQSFIAIAFQTVCTVQFCTTVRRTQSATARSTVLSAAGRDVSKSRSIKLQSGLIAKRCDNKLHAGRVESVWARFGPTDGTALA